MDPVYARGTGSVVQIAGHPLHPMIVPLVIGSVVAAFAADIAFVATARPVFLDIGRYALLAGILTGALAALSGAVEFMSLPRARTMGIGWGHAIANAAVFLLMIVNYRVRMQDGIEPVVPYGLILSGVAFVLTGLAGWFGGEMVYRHGIGVSGSMGAAAEDGTTGTSRDIGKS
jgi:uncharacterized membrane protein